MNVRKMTLAQVKAYVRKHKTWDGWMMPCKMYDFTHFAFRTHLSMDSNGDLVNTSSRKAFVTTLNEFMYYNCSYETGYYAHYYMMEN